MKKETSGERDQQASEGSALLFLYSCARPGLWTLSARYGKAPQEVKKGTEEVARPHSWSHVGQSSETVGTQYTTTPNPYRARPGGEGTKAIGLHYELI